MLCKARSIAHVEYVNSETDNTDFIKKMVASGEDITGCGYRFFPIKIDDTFPVYLRTNSQRYARLVVSVDDAMVRRTQFLRLRFWLRGWIRRAVANLIPRAVKPFLFRVYCNVVSNPIKI